MEEVPSFRTPRGRRKKTKRRVRGGNAVNWVPRETKQGQLVGDAGTMATGDQVAFAGDTNMRRFVLVTSLALGLLVPFSSAQGDWTTIKTKWNAYWDRVHLDWHRNNAWPEPFSSTDKAAQRAPFPAMVDRGWQLQNTIPDQLFQTETQELTHAGELKVKWIVTQMPARRRSVFVMRGSTPEITELRLKSVSKIIAEIGNGTGAMVAVTDIIPRDGSASAYERTLTSFDSSQPAPQLPAREESGE